MKHLSCTALLLALSGCVTLEGDYDVSATDASGKPLNVVMSAQGRNIYTARNAICSAYPGAVVTIRDTRTQQELTSESPHHCR